MSSSPSAVRAIELFLHADALLTRGTTSVLSFVMRWYAEPGNRRAGRSRALIVLTALFIFVSFAATADDSLLQLNAIDQKFRGLQDSWYSVVKGFAMGLFWKLALVDFCWSTVVYVLEKKEAEDIFISLVRKTFTLGFFFSLLKMSDTWIPAIIKSFITIGKAASGSGDLTPDGIVDKGLDLAMGAFQTMKGLGTFDKIAVVLPVTFMALVVFLAFLWVAGQLLVTLIESYIAVGLGVILLGFGGSRWTTDFATKYLQFAVGTGIKLMVLYAIVGGGQTLFSGLMIDADQLMKSCLIATGMSFIYAYLAINIPQLATAMMSGSPNLTAGSFAGAAATVGAAALGASAVAATTGQAAGSGAASGLAGAVGLNNALNAGLASAADHGKTGLDAVGHAVGQVASHGTGIAGTAVGDAASSAKATWGSKVENSAGGKIATSIESTRGGSMQGTPSAAPTPAPTPGSAGGASAPSGAGTSTDSGGGDSGAASGATGAEAGQAASGNGAATSAAGDASSASVTGNSVAPPSSGGQPAEKRSLASKVRDLDGYIPQDSAGQAAINIDLSHTRD